MDARDTHLKKIQVAELRLGMHLHAFEGNWLNHPFWKTRFVLNDSADIRRALGSSVRECWISTDRGLDLAGEPAPERPVPQRIAAPAVAATAPTAAFALTSPPAAPLAGRPARAAMADELGQAARLCERSR